jgi:hypothetical protein
VTDAAGNLLFALLTTPLAIYVVAQMRPFHRREGEARLDLLYRWYLRPASAVFAAVLCWEGVFGLGALAHGAGWKPVIALGWTALMAGATAGLNVKAAASNK